MEWSAQLTYRVCGPPTESAAHPQSLQLDHPQILQLTHRVCSSTSKSAAHPQSLQLGGALTHPTKGFLPRRTNNAN